MADSQQPDSQPQERTDWSNPWVVAGGLLFWGFFIILALPPAIFLLPLAIPALVVLYLIAGGNTKKARALGKRRLGADGKSDLDVDFSPGMTAALALNDWGIVLARFWRRPIELAWSDLTLVDEPAIAMLAFHTADGLAFQVDLSQDRYFLAIESIHAKIPGRTDFLIDPPSGRSKLLDKLAHAPFVREGKWGRFAVTAAGVEQGAESMTWEEIIGVREFHQPGDESASYWVLKFIAPDRTFCLTSSDFEDGRQVGNSDYDLIKAYAAERLPRLVSFDRDPSLPADRALEEFKRGHEVYAAALSLALKSGKFDYLAPRYRHLFHLVDLFGLDAKVGKSSFFHDYAELLSRTGRPHEAAAMQARAASAFSASQRSALPS